MEKEIRVGEGKMRWRLWKRDGKREIGKVLWGTRERVKRNGKR
jgi:hypothetical protein